MSALSLRFRTLVFMDLESTSVFPEELRKNINITEVCFISIHIDRFNEKARPPRVFNKLTLCVQPKTSISPTAMNMTGLDNLNLECQQKFTSATANLLVSFFGQHEGPICLLAHNGSNFDFPLLKAEMHAVGVTLPEYVYCMDTLTASKHLIGANFISKYVDDEYVSECSDNENGGGQSDTSVFLNELDILPLGREPIKEIDGFGPKTQQECFKIIENGLSILNSNYSPITPKHSNVRVGPYPTPPKSAQKISKRLSFGTPKKRRIIDFSNADKEYYASNTKGYRLAEVYRKVIGGEMEHAHEAEADVINLIRVCHKLDAFVEFIEFNAKPFRDPLWVKPLWTR